GLQDTSTYSFTAIHLPFLLSLQGIPFDAVLGILAVIAGVAIVAIAWIRRPKRPLDTREKAMRLAPGVVVAGVGAGVAVLAWFLALCVVAVIPFPGIWRLSSLS